MTAIAEKNFNSFQILNFENVYHILTSVRIKIYKNKTIKQIVFTLRKKSPTEKTKIPF